MNYNEHTLQPCPKCSYNAYEIIDGHYYCTECHEQYLNVIVEETDEFAQTETKKSTITLKPKEKKAEGEININY